MPEQLQHAVIAVEDQFYEHPGIDVVGVFRAAWTDLVEQEIVQGGSTITQQLVKNVYAGQYEEDPETGVETYVIPPRTLGQKVSREPAGDQGRARVHQGPDPRQVPQHRLLRSGCAYGVQAAAQTFFQKDASQLTVNESALLAAMIQSPSYYDPEEQETAALERRNYVLERMAAEGYLSSELAARLAAKDIKVDPIEVGLNFPAKLGYFLDYTRRELIDVYGEGPVFSGGLQVTTTLDSRCRRTPRRPSRTA